MSLVVFSTIKDEVRLLPFFLAHYGAIADKIIIYDEASEDGSLALMEAHPKVEIREWPVIGLDEQVKLDLVETMHREFEGVYDWAAWVDVDEFLWHPHFTDILAWDCNGFEVVLTQGYNMVDAGGIPNYDGRQIWEVIQRGVKSPVYSKPILFRPGIEIGFVRGLHALERCCPIISDKPYVKLLHYRYLNASYTRSRNKRNYKRSPSKATAWSCHKSWTGEHSPMWAATLEPKAFNVIECKMET